MLMLPEKYNKLAVITWIFKRLSRAFCFYWLTRRSFKHQRIRSTFSLWVRPACWSYADRSLPGAEFIVTMNKNRFDLQHFQPRHAERDFFNRCVQSSRLRRLGQTTSIQARKACCITDGPLITCKRLMIALGNLIGTSLESNSPLVYVLFIKQIWISAMGWRRIS